MDIENNGDFSIIVTNEVVVRAAMPIHEHRLPLSNLDLLLPPVAVGVFLCYKNPMPLNKMSFGLMIEPLKEALSQVLVSYYPLAGEVIYNDMGEPELLCNNSGVDFIEAVADIQLQHLNFYNPDLTIEGKFIPKKKHGVLVVQVTSLKCGGIIVACTFDHRIADAYSANMFLVSWAEMAHSTKPKPKTISTKPCFHRSLLLPRSPGYFDSSLNHLYIPISNLIPSSSTIPLLSRIYYITSHQLHNIQSLVAATNSDCIKRTKLESFSAFLWKILARVASRDKKGKMGIVVDGRKRLINGTQNKARKTMMECYFGNVLSIPFGGILVDELMEKPLGIVADAVHDFLMVATTEEHFLGLIDWVEAHRPIPGLARIYGDNTNAGPTFVVSSGLRFPKDKVNFGWGKVMLMSYHFPWNSEVGYVMPMPSPVGNGDWIVYMHLVKEQFEIIDSDAAQVFKPVTWDYLNQ